MLTDGDAGANDSSQIFIELKGSTWPSFLDNHVA